VGLRARRAGARTSGLALPGERVQRHDTLGRSSASGGSRSGLHGVGHGSAVVEARRVGWVERRHLGQGVRLRPVGSSWRDGLARVAPRRGAQCAWVASVSGIGVGAARGRVRAEGREERERAGWKREGNQGRRRLLPGSQRARARLGSRYRCTFVLCLIGRPKAHNFWHDPYLARPNLIVGLGRHGPHCGPCLGLKSSPRAGLARPI
jgi:hypothetical protein